MRVLAFLIAAVVCAACGGAEEHEAAPPGTSSAAATGRVDAAAVARVRSELPPGYEVADLSGPVAPIDLWGMGPDWAATPGECGGLADRAAGPAGEHGWSASGPGGIVYAVVAQDVGPDPSIGDVCAQWTVSAGHTRGSVSYLPAPTIDQAPTVGLSTDLTTQVEGGIETHSQAMTFTAHLADHVVYVVVVTDPGSPGPALTSGFASDLLVRTVSTIRG